MHIQIDEQGWLINHRIVASPFYNERPNSCQPTLLVIHNISLPPKQYGGDYIDQLFTGTLNPDEHPYFQNIYQLQVSAHVLIRRNGEITQYVSFLKRAWHAGQSFFMERENCNDFSIGIELEGCDDEPFTSAQYLSLSALSKALIQVYPLNYVTGHCDIAPQRKTDPGSHFVWEDYLMTLPTNIQRYVQ